MNSNYGKPNQTSASSASLKNFNFDFDIGIGSNRPRSLNDQKNPKSSSHSYSSSSSSYSSGQPRPSWQPNKPSWTHQPAPNLANQSGLPGGPTSMAGDIFGKSWGSTQPSASSSTIGVVNKNPNLFGDLVSSALGQNSKGSNNAPIKSIPVSKASGTTSNKSSFSMDNMAGALPKTSNTTKNSGSWGSSGYTNTSTSANKSPNLGGPSMRSMNSGSSAGSGTNVNRDPFSSLAGFGSKPSGSLNSAGKAAKNNNVEDDGFGDFQNASKPGSATFPSSSSIADDISFTGSTNLNQKPMQTSAGGDPIDMFFSSSSAAAGSAAVPSEGFGGKSSSGIDDWGLDSEFGGGAHDVGGTTTELEGLPPPPAGLTGLTAKGKGMDNYKQGQFADAIKWLSWAVILLEKTEDNAGMTEVLSCRASCYKEVGEYKKAVADCTKVLESDDTNVSILVQRALLYESMEKYKLGAEDLRNVLKIDPGNRVARSTIHRLTKLAD
ncbi:induced during hyphae development protein 1-like [Prosopis cineraria]|uniref:induced during hyphae development protein 1-like n=1 Tax=Prosopis cineraria TaxID=364024 RepID=UPI00240FCE9A|nr:induced during hyphae development protein 1-like [Prosopis cineraria]XP_054791196.1 induced during hyphae development protein 1-like [Prosopis cineraria]